MGGTGLTLTIVSCFQMKKHMQDLNNKISRQGLVHNELWGARLIIITTAKVQWTEIISSAATRNVRYVPHIPFQLLYKNQYFPWEVFYFSSVNNCWFVADFTKSLNEWIVGCLYILCICEISYKSAGLIISDD